MRFLIYSFRQFLFPHDCVFCYLLLFQGMFSEAALWQEYTAPDGRKYYYNTQTQETTWDKPKALEGSFFFLFFVHFCVVKIEIKIEIFKNISCKNISFTLKEKACSFFC